MRTQIREARTSDRQKSTIRSVNQLQISNNNTAKFTTKTGKSDVGVAEEGLMTLIVRPVEFFAVNTDSRPHETQDDSQSSPSGNASLKVLITVVMSSGTSGREGGLISC